MTLNNLTEKSEDARLLYGNVCVFLLKKAKNEYFENLNLHNVTGTNKFWKTVKPAFRIRFKTCNTSSLIKNLLLSYQKKHLLKP